MSLTLTLTGTGGAHRAFRHGAVIAWPAPERDAHRSIAASHAAA